MTTAGLTHHPLFAGMKPEHLAWLADCAHEEEYETGQYLFREGEPADRCWLVSHGKVALEIAGGPKALIVETLEEADVIGWSWLFPPHRWSFDARVVEPMKATVLDGTRLLEKKSADHEFGYELMMRFAAVIIERLQAARVQLQDVYGLDD